MGTPNDVGRLHKAEEDQERHPRRTAQPQGYARSSNVTFGS